MFGNFNKSNNNNNVNVNTTLYTSYSDLALVRISAWNKSISLSVQPCEGRNNEGLRQYADRKDAKSISTALVSDNAVALLTGIKEEILPAIKAKKKATVSVTMGSNDNKKVLSIIADENGGVYLSLAQHVDDKGQTDKGNIVTHKFNKKSYYTSYSPSEGLNNEVEANTDFATFTRSLESIYQLDGAVAHSIEYANKLKSSMASHRSFNNDNNGGSYQAPTENIQMGPDDPFPFG